MHPCCFLRPFTKRALSLIQQRVSLSTHSNATGARRRAVAMEDKLLWEASPSDTLAGTHPEILPLP